MQRSGVQGEGEYSQRVTPYSMQFNVIPSSSLHRTYYAKQVVNSKVRSFAQVKPSEVRRRGDKSAIGMGNHVGRNVNTSSKNKTVAGGVTSADNRPGKPMSRSASGNDMEHNNIASFLPVEKLTKMLADHAHKEESVNGITRGVLEKYLFPHYPELAGRIFRYLRHCSGATTDHLGQSAFKQQAEKLLSIMNDQIILESYVNMYSDLAPESEVEPESIRELFMTCYRIAMDDEAGTCLYVHSAIGSVLVSCFHGKSSLSVGYVSNWLRQHCPRIINGLHRYIVHVLTTAYRNGPMLMSREELQPHMEPVTPVLEKTIFCDQQPLLPMSHVWLLATSLPLCYTQAEDSPTDGTQALIVKMSGNPCPSHWTLLYNSAQHGAGANRFLHHVLGYRGPTLLFIRGASTKENEPNPIYCVCATVEWRETHLYWGDEESMIIELQPAYKVVERGPKLVYLNTGIRGYPLGLRAGSNPRNPSVCIDEAFSSVSFNGVTHRIASLEVWGCGDRKSREKQLEIKKWQVKEAEKQRVVKLSTTDWLDHPDRYLLELAGRPSYNNDGK